MTEQTPERPYGERAITVDVLKTWIPIGLTVGTIVIGIVSTITGMLLTNNSRLARLEVQMEQIQSDSKDVKQAQRETNALIQRYLIEGQQRDARQRQAAEN